MGVWRITKLSCQDTSSPPQKPTPRSNTNQHKSAKAARLSWKFSGTLLSVKCRSMKISAVTSIQKMSSHCVWASVYLLLRVHPWMISAGLSHSPCMRELTAKHQVSSQKPTFGRTSHDKTESSRKPETSTSSTHSSSLWRVPIHQPKCSQYIKISDFLQCCRQKAVLSRPWELKHMQILWWLFPVAWQL